MENPIIEVCRRAGRAGPEARLLILLAGIAGPGAELPLSELRRRLGVSVRVMARVMRELADLGALADVEASLPERADGRVGRGRGAMLRLAAPFQSMRFEHDGAELPCPQWRRAVLMLGLVPRSVGREALVGRPPLQLGAGGELSASNRLLLAVLLAKADECGVVRGTRPAELAQLAGMTGIQLRGQVEKLHRLGFIRAIVPGVTGGAIFGVCPGAYFLNVGHPAFGAIPAPGWWLIFPADDFVGSGWLVRDVEQLYVLLQKFSRADMSEYWRSVLSDAGFRDRAEIQRVAKFFFDGKGSPNLPGFLQAKVEAYASWLLTHHRSGLGSRVHVEAMLTPRVYEDLFPARRFPVDRDEALDGSAIADRNSAARLVVSLATMLARKIDQALKASFRSRHDEFYGTSWDELEDCHFVIMPKPVRLMRPHIALYVVPKRAEVVRSSSAGWVFEMHRVAGNEWRPESSVKWGDVSEENALRWGMLSTAKGR